MNLFRKLSRGEEVEFRQSARENYKPLSTIEGVWHPVYQAECVKINQEAGDNFSFTGSADEDQELMEAGRKVLDDDKFIVIERDRCQ